MVIAVGETRNARAFDYRCLHESAGGTVVRSDARVSMEERERGGGRRSRGDHLRIVEYTRSTNIQRYYVPSALFRL